jgi:hypothetical protein
MTMMPGLRTKMIPIVTELYLGQGIVRKGIGSFQGGEAGRPSRKGLFLCLCKLLICWVRELNIRPS